jgi:hypothetical protein
MKSVEAGKISEEGFNCAQSLLALLFGKQPNRPFPNLW